MSEEPLTTINKPNKKVARIYLATTIVVIIILLAIFYYKQTSYFCYTSKSQIGDSSATISNFTCVRHIPSCSFSVISDYISQNRVVNNTCGTTQFALDMKSLYAAQT